MDTFLKSVVFSYSAVAKAS